MKVRDKQSVGFLEKRKFKNKADLRNCLLWFAKQEGWDKENDLRKYTLLYLLDLFDLEIILKGGLK